MSVKSVYNFVPAPKESEVFKPDWAEQVSHDLPFEDGESGEIELEITAKSPIFIRNGHSKQDADLFEKQKKGELPNPTKEQQKAIDRYLSFSHVIRNGAKDYFIPGSSLKGMSRNVLEIMSFSRINLENDIFSYRDLNGKEFKNNVAQNNSLKTGWLGKSDGVWFIRECDFGRINFGKWNKSEYTAVKKYEEYFSSKKGMESFEFVDELERNRGSVYENIKGGSFKGYQKI